MFGPVLSIISFNTEEDAIRIDNDTIYGLAAGVWTQIWHAPFGYQNFCVPAPSG